MNSVEFVHTDLNPRYEYLVADLTYAYPPSLKLTRYWRHFIFIQKSTLLIMDEIRSDTTHLMEWRLHSDTLLQNSQLNNRIRFASPDSNAGMVIESISLSPA